MIRDDDETPRTQAVAVHHVGDVIDTLSVEDLRSRIAMLRQEIVRLEAAVATKEASKSAAEAFFKR